MNAIEFNKFQRSNESMHSSKFLFTVTVNYIYFIYLFI